MKIPAGKLHGVWINIMKIYKICNKYSVTIALLPLLLLCFLGGFSTVRSEVRYEIECTLDAASPRIEGSVLIILTGNDIPRDDVIFVNRNFGQGRTLELAGITVNGVTAQIDATGDVAGIAVPGSARNRDRLDINIGFQLAVIPENEGIVLLDDNRRDGRWESWYPRLVERSSHSASYEVKITLRGADTLAHSAPVQSETDLGGARIYTLSDNQATSLVISTSQIFHRQRAFVHESDLGLFSREGSEDWGDHLVTAFSEVYGHYAEAIPGFQRPRLDLVLAAADYPFSDFSPQLVVIKDEQEEMTGRFGGVFAANYLRWKVAVELARVFWGGIIAGEQDSIPWLREGLALRFAEDYSKAAMLGGPAFDNIRQFYLNAAAADLNTSLTQSRREAERIGLDPLKVLAQSKGLWVIAMLEDQMGRAGWISFTGHLAGLPQGSMLSAAEVEKIAEKEAGEPLGDFFKTWTEGDARLDYAVGAVRSEGDKTRVQIKALGEARLPVEVRAVFSDGSEKTRIVVPKDEDVWIEFASGGRLRRIEVDPEGKLPDIRRSDNFKSLGGSERIEKLFAIDNLFDIGEVLITKAPEWHNGDRSGEFEITITNKTDQPAALGMWLTTRFSGGRNRGIAKIFLELAPNETLTIREELPFPKEGLGLAYVQVNFFPVADRQAFERIEKGDRPDLINYYVTEIVQ